jgi:hypothetical protein
MKIIFSKTAYSSTFVTPTSILVTLIFCSATVYGQRDFSKLTTSRDSTFGYTNFNPLKLKKGNQGKSIDNSYKFLAGLKTLDNQSLTLLFRSSEEDPAYKEPAIRINNRFNGMPLSGKLERLDKYVFLTSNTKDAVTLFVDIYNKGDLFLSVGLKYEQQQE